MKIVNLCCMSKKSFPSLYSVILYIKINNKYFLDVQEYNEMLHSYVRNKCSTIIYGTPLKVPLMILFAMTLYL